MADETRKSDYLGDVFGDWEVTARAEGTGDRKRRWEVTNVTTGVTMSVLQTGLKDLALAKNLADRAAAADAARTEIGTPLTPEQAEEALLVRLDGQIANTLLLAEARASVALDHDPECGTYSLETLVAANHPFNDYLALAEAELAAGDPFALSPTTVAILADRNRCADCEEGNHPDIRPVSAIELGIGFVEPTGTLVDLAQFKARLHAAADYLMNAQRAMKLAEDMLCDILEELL